MGLDAANNPPALIRSPAVKDSIRAILAEALGVPEEVIVVEVGSATGGWGTIRTCCTSDVHAVSVSSSADTQCHAQAAG